MAAARKSSVILRALSRAHGLCAAIPIKLAGCCCCCSLWPRLESGGRPLIRSGEK